MKEQILKLQEVFAKAKGISVDLALIDDIEKLLDKGLAEKRKSEKIIRKAADELQLD